MAIEDRRRREKHELRQLILEGAEKVMARDGYDNLSIRRVAKEIEYSPGTIYLYYHDKKELLLALHQKAFACYQEEFRPLLEIDHPIDRIMAMGHAYIDHAVRHPDEFSLMFVLDQPMHALARHDKNWTIGETGLGMVIQALQEGVDRGFFRPDLDTEATAFMLWSTVHGVAMLHLSGRLLMIEEAGLPNVRAGVLNSLEMLLRDCLRG